MEKIKVFIAGPYTNGDVAVNVGNAITVGNEILEMGYIPIIPHLSHFQHMMFPQPYEVWLECSIAMLKMCDIVVRLPGHSPGADRECKTAADLNIPVFEYSYFHKYHILQKQPIVKRREDGKTSAG